MMGSSLDDTDVILKQPPLDSVLDGYYKVDETMNLTKLRAIKTVMKSAISITKSKTGEVILKTNRIEQANLKRKIDVVRKERTFAEVDINRNKIVFKAQYKKWMDYRKHVPVDIQGIKDRYKQIKYTMKQRQLQSDNYSVNNLKLGSLPFSSITEASGLSRLRVPQKSYPYSQPSRQIASRENLSRQNKRGAEIWRERTFDMPAIRNLLVDQQLKQDSMFCKKRIENWKMQVLERQKTINEHFRFTRTGDIANDTRHSASTEGSYDRLPTPTFYLGPPAPSVLPKIPDKSKTFMNPPSVTHDKDEAPVLLTRASYGGPDSKKLYKNGQLKNKASKLSSSLNLKGKSVSFDT